MNLPLPGHHSCHVQRLFHLCEWNLEKVIPSSTWIHVPLNPLVVALVIREAQHKELKPVMETRGLCSVREIAHSQVIDKARGHYSRSATNFLAFSCLKYGVDG